MRRRYSKKSNSPKKQFVNSYHLNEVPLPYYNPLGDPCLKGFFSNSKNKKVLHSQGLLFKPKKEYPYAERRLTNFNKFLRNNSFHVPPTHTRHQSQIRLIGKSSSYADFMNEVESTQSQLVKRMSDSDMVNSDLRLSFNKDALSQRPTTNNSSRRAVFSQDGRRQCIFRRSQQKAARNMMDNSCDLIF